MTESNLTIGVVQCALGDERERNLDRVEQLVREAAAKGARVILTPELIEGPYFCTVEEERYFEWAAPVSEHPTLLRFSRVAAELGVVLPISFFERAGQAHYNSVAILDADGTRLGTYRKSHIPDGPGYEEKFYFRPGDTGFRIWRTRHGTIGVGICWDQWFPECARAMALLGAEALLYPTAIGTEPAEPKADTRDPWQRVMIGHAVANAMPVAAANRIGEERVGESPPQTYYGSSFIADARGDKVAELLAQQEGVAVASFDRGALARYRANWGFFRDRRPALYGALETADGETKV